MPEFSKQPRYIPRIEKIDGLTFEDREEFVKIFNEYGPMMSRIGEKVLQQKLDEDYPELPDDDNPNIERGEN